MKSIFVLLTLSLSLSFCNKKSGPEPANCDINQAKLQNALKVTITNGVWGTVSSLEGNCQPTGGPNPNCTECTIKRTVRIYELTNETEATPDGNSEIFFTAFSTAMVKEVETDNNGFFQAELPPGQYSLVIMENGKLHASNKDAQGDLNAFSHAGNQTMVNFRMTYKAIF